MNRALPVYRRSDKEVFFRLAREELVAPKSATTTAMKSCNEQNLERAEVMAKTLRDAGPMFEHIQREYPVNREAYMKWRDNDAIDYMFGFWNTLQRQGQAPIFDRDIDDSEFEYVRVALLAALGAQPRNQSSEKNASSDIATSASSSLVIDLDFQDSNGVAADMGFPYAQVSEPSLAAQDQPPTQQEKNPLLAGDMRDQFGRILTGEASSPFSIWPDPQVSLSQSVRLGEGSRANPITFTDRCDDAYALPLKYPSAWKMQDPMIQRAQCDSQMRDQSTETSVPHSKRRIRDDSAETKQGRKRCKQTDFSGEVIDLTLDSGPDSAGPSVPRDCYVDVWHHFNMNHDMPSAFSTTAAASFGTEMDSVAWPHADAQDDPIDAFLKLYATELSPATNAPIVGMIPSFGGTYKSNRPVPTSGFPPESKQHQRFGPDDWSSLYSEGSTGLWTNWNESKHGKSAGSDGWTNL